MNSPNKLIQPLISVCGLMRQQEGLHGLRSSFPSDAPHSSPPVSSRSARIAAPATVGELL